MPTITIIMPVYNAEREVARCIESIKNQTWSDYECLCINNASTDASAVALAESIKGDERFRLIESPRNGMPGMARNIGLDQAQGDYIVFIDGDDYVHPRYLELLYSCQQAYDTDIAACLYTVVDQLEVIDMPKLSMGGVKANVTQDPFNDYRKDTKTVSTSVWNKLYRRSVLAEVRFHEDRCYEDTLFTIQVLSSARNLVYCPQVLYYYYKRPASIMQSSFSGRKYEDFIVSLNLIGSYLKQTYPLSQPETCFQIINPLIKMLVNQIRKKQKDSALQYDEVCRLKDDFRQLLQEGYVSYAGIKWKQKIMLKLLMSCRSPKWAYRWMKLC